jgi:photosystem II stability/assembly factor-like uncharacterized protein
VAGLATAGGVVFAATPAGIRRSEDSGQSWSVAGVSEAVPFAAIVAPSPSFERDHTLFAAGRAGAYRSRDGGNSWTPVLTGAILALAVAPGVLFAGTEEDGVLRSTDEGRTWNSANPGVLDLTVLSIALSPEFARDRTAFLGTASGLYRSRNGGSSWRAAELGGEEPAVQCVAASPAFERDHLVFAGTEADGLLRSTDGGETWSRVASFPAHTVNALTFSHDGEISAGTDQGVALSNDGGQSWLFVFDASDDQVLSLVYLDEGSHLLAGLAANGVASSADHGRSWTVVDQGLLARLLTRIAAASSGCLFVADLQGGIRVSRDAGVTWEDADPEPQHSPVASLAVAEAETVFAATARGLFRSTDHGVTWHGVEALPGAPARLVIAGGLRLLVVIEDHGVFASGDAGHTWRPIATPFGTEHVASAVFGAGSAVYMATVERGEAVLWCSADGGDRWRRWLVEPISGAEVLPLAGDPVLDLVFVGMPGGVLHPIPNATEVRGGERRPMWRAAALELAGSVVTDLALSRTFARDRTLLAGTNRGIFASTDGGERFTSWSEGLDPSSIVSLAWPDADTVYALTLGGGLWRRSADDLR